MGNGTRVTTGEGTEWGVSVKILAERLDAEEVAGVTVVEATELIGWRRTTWLRRLPEIAV